jgi:hypothetical protein
VQRGALGVGRTAACALAAALIALGGRPARAQTAPAPPGAPGEIDLSRIFGAVPGVLFTALEKGHTELFKVIEDVELLDVENEIDRYVGRPRLLNDSTSYKLSLLPFEIQFPIYRQLVDQMTRLDTVRSRRIYTVTPESVSLIDLTIQPVATLDAFAGEGVGSEVASSLTTAFSAREIADLSVFLLAQQRFFPSGDDGWDATKHRVARAAVPLALGALATGALFDAGALLNAGTIVTLAPDLRLKYYAGFRGLGVHLRPYLRGGLALEGKALEASVGLADQINPLPTEPDRALEVAVREGWLNQLVRPLGMDAFVEAALRRTIQEQVGFTGPLNAARAGLFWKRDQIPLFPTLALRGSAEAESDLDQHLHLVASLGVERPRSGITTVLQTSRLVNAPSAGVPDDARINLFFAGTMEPLSSLFSDDMVGLARRCDAEWAGLEALELRREAWERALLAHRTASRTSGQARAMLVEMEGLLAEREERMLRLGAALADYLESRRRAYGVLGWSGTRDHLHGPLDAGVLAAARDRVLGRLRDLSGELEGERASLLALRGRMEELEQEVRRLEAVEPGGAGVASRRRVLAELEQEWDLETERVRHQLAARDRLRADGTRILAALDRPERSIRDFDTLGEAARSRILRLASLPVP